MTWWRGLITVAAAVLLVGLASANAGRVAADGFTQEILRADTGPYEYAVGIFPYTPSVGSMHFAIYLGLPAKNSDVRDAVVTLSGVSADGKFTAGPAVGKIIDSTYYHEMDVVLGTPGRWNFTIDIQSAAGPATVHFPLDVPGTPASESPGLAVARVLVPLLVLGFGGLLVYKALMGSKKTPGSPPSGAKLKR